MRVLLGCEESQIICRAFREYGHEAFSCDILPCSGGHPEWHIQDDVLKHLNDGWDLMIAHPPCTFLAISGAQWFYHPEDNNLPIEQRRPHPKYPNRAKDREEAIQFFISLANAPIKKKAIENPVGIMNTKWRPPDQIIHPYMFGDEAQKTTCLWLTNLPLLYHNKEINLFDDNITHVSRGEMVKFKSGKSHPKWYAEAFGKSKEERQSLRSKTFPGIALAMAKQWGELTN